MSHASSKKPLLFVQFCAARGFCKRVLNSRICQHCDVKTSTVTPTFHYLFIIFLTCYISAPSFSYNLCQVLLPWNHLKPHANGAALLVNNSQHCWMLHVASVCTPRCILLRVVGSCGLPRLGLRNNVGRVCTAFFNIVGASHALYTCFPKSNGLYPSHDALQVPTLLGVVASVCTPLQTWTQKLPSLLAQHQQC